MAAVEVGEDCLISADVRFVGDDHSVRGSGLIRETPTQFPQPIVIGDDVLIGAGPDWEWCSGRSRGCLEG